MPYAAKTASYKLVVVNPSKYRPIADQNAFRARIPPLSREVLIALILALTLAFFALPVGTLAQQQALFSTFNSGLPDASRSATFPIAQQSIQEMSGTITGTVLDSTGAAIAGARLKLSRSDQLPVQETQADEDGQFSFVDVAPGPFQLTITSPGFAAQTSSGILHPGEIFVVAQIVLPVATEITEIRVSPSLVEEAEEEIKIEEKQRVFGVIPNFYVSYVPNAARLDTKQKFELAWRSTIDPVTFLLVGGVAGVQQAQNDFSGFGQGAQGYGKRYGAAYANLVTGTFIGSAILPSILKQDPRYFYKGTGGVKSRVLYAVANAVICKGDNGHWQPNYSGILGSLAAGGISNTYYPSQNGVALTFENTLIGIGTTAAVNVIQEFVIPKLTPNLPNHQSSKP
jgi:hypothetical protein